MSAEMMIVTGEASGDMYGSLLASQMMAMDSELRISGVGGERMREAGVRILLDSKDLSVVGFWEAIAHLGKLRHALQYLKEQIWKLRPDLLILIDYPGMNLRLARFARRKGIKVMYYVSPQVWAWGKNRIKLIKKYVDKMVVILPFEVDIYREEGIDATYVGHPLIDVVKPELDRETFFQSLGLEPSKKLVALMPGSRTQEIRNHIRPLVRTASLLRQRFSWVDFTVLSLHAFKDMVIEGIRADGEDIPITTEYRYDAMYHSDLAIACSGTATLEAALLGTPMIVIYKLALFSWAVGKIIVKVPHISLANLVAGEEIVPEYIQGAVNPRALADEAERILIDDANRNRIKDQLEKVKIRLGPGGASGKAAELALTLAEH